LAFGDFVFGDGSLFGLGADGHGGVSFGGEEAGDGFAILGLDAGHLEIGADDRVWIDDVFEEVSDAVAAGAGEFGAELDAVVAELVALRAEGDETRSKPRAGLR
jgi:hypothetical protein